MSVLLACIIAYTAFIGGAMSAFAYQDNRLGTTVAYQAMTALVCALLIYGG